MAPHSSVSVPFAQMLTTCPSFDTASRVAARLPRPAPQPRHPGDMAADPIATFEGVIRGVRVAIGCGMSWNTAILYVGLFRRRLQSERHPLLLNRRDVVLEVMGRVDQQLAQRHDAILPLHRHTAPHLWLERAQVHGYLLTRPPK